MQAVTTITKGEISVRGELDLLGLTPEDLIGAILFGETHRALCTDDDPLIFHGTTAWARTIRGLRQQNRLRQNGWTKARAGNFETFVSPDKSLAVCVMTGDKETGKYDPSRPFISPKPKHPKGIMLKTAIDTNAWLFPELAAAANDRARKLEMAAKRTTWILLIHRDGDTVFAELSLPSKFSVDQVEAWRHRIILEPIDVEPLIDVRDDSGDDSGDIIDVPVERIN
jgi:hypothetical protein